MMTQKNHLKKMTWENGNLIIKLVYQYIEVKGMKKFDTVFRGYDKVQFQRCLDEIINN